MSPRAAWRLEQLGFGAVYDYVAGKVDWIAAGLPTVRIATAEQRAIEAIDAHSPVARLGQRVADIVVSSARSVVVVNGAGVVLGRVTADDLRADPDALVESLMSLGPTRVRAHEPLDALRERMRSRNVRDMIVTTPEGVLLGVVHDDGWIVGR